MHFIAVALANFSQVNLPVSNRRLLQKSRLLELLGKRRREVTKAQLHLSPSELNRLRHTYGELVATVRNGSVP